MPGTISAMADPATRKCRVRIMIISDMEGVSGIVKWEQVSGGERLYEEGRVLYTEEINAAVRGARAAGATEVVVMDYADVSLPGAKAIKLNLSDPASIDRAVDECGGPIHALFSCAGVADGTPGIELICCGSAIPSLMNTGSTSSAGRSAVSATMARSALVPRSRRALTSGNPALIASPVPVLADTAPAPTAADERGIRAPDRAEDVGVDVLAHASADVVGAEDVRVEHCLVLTPGISWAGSRTSERA